VTRGAHQDKTKQKADGVPVQLLTCSSATNLWDHLSAGPRVSGRAALDPRLPRTAEPSSLSRTAHEHERKRPPPQSSPVRPRPGFAPSHFSESDGQHPRHSGGRGSDRKPRLALASLFPLPAAEDGHAAVDWGRRRPPFVVVEGSGGGGQGRHGLRQGR
jgi:hypothetical protein